MRVGTDVCQTFLKVERMDLCTPENHSISVADNFLMQFSSLPYTGYLYNIFLSPRNIRQVAGTHTQTSTASINVSINTNLQGHEPYLEATVL